MSEWAGEAVRLFGEGWALENLAARFGVTKAQVGTVVRDATAPSRLRRSPVNPKHVAFVRENYHKFPASHIAARLGITRNAVVGIAWRNGLCEPAQ